MHTQTQLKTLNLQAQLPQHLQCIMILLGKVTGIHLIATVHRYRHATVEIECTHIHKTNGFNYYTIILQLMPPPPNNTPPTGAYNVVLCPERLWEHWRVFLVVLTQQ